MKNQRGYLLIVAIVLIVIVAFSGTIIVSHFINSAKSAGGIIQSNAAFNIASSGIEIAKRDIIINKIDCETINGDAKYTDASFADGQFTVTADSNLAASSLHNAINANNTSITLNDTSGFADSGIITIDYEHIRYHNISGNILLNAVRGTNGTIPIYHANGANVTQKQCVLTATGATPTISASAGKRILQEALVGVNFSFPGGASPALASVGKVEIMGNSYIINPMVTFSDTHFPGSTIVTGETLQISGATGGTQVNDGSGGLIDSTNSSQSPGDVITNFPYITSANLFSYYFNQPKSVIKASADIIFSSGVSNLADLNGIAGQTIWIDGSINWSTGSAVVGTASNPAILIIDGALEMIGNSNLTLNGLLYVTGDITMAGTSQLSGLGAVATEGSTTIAGTPAIQFDPGIITLINILNPYTAIYYESSPATFKEIFV